MEGAYALANNLGWDTLVEFSEQQIIDCSKKYGNLGCDGGFEDAAMTYAMDVGLTTEQEYPYRIRQDKCKYKPEDAVGKPKNCTYVTPSKFISGYFIG